MNGPRPGGPGRPFDPSELEGVARRDEVAADIEAARALERFAARTSVSPTPDFADRVMAAIVREPSPAPARAAWRAVRRRSITAFLASVTDSWSVLTRPGFPAMVRAQALAVVLAVAVAVGATGLGGAAAVGMLAGDGQSPAPTVSPEPSPAPSESPSPFLSPSPGPSDEPSAEPSAEPSGSPSAEPSDDTSASPGGGGASPQPTATDGEDRTPRPAETLKPGESLKPGETLKPAETP